MEWMNVEGKETVRVYYYDNGFKLTIRNAKRLSVTDSFNGSKLGGHAHRIETKDGYSFYVPPGWVSVSWDGVFNPYNPSEESDEV